MVSGVQRRPLTDSVQVLSEDTPALMLCDNQRYLLIADYFSFQKNISTEKHLYYIYSKYAFHYQKYTFQFKLQSTIPSKLKKFLIKIILFSH